MAIVGLTHNESGVIEDKVVKYRGKLSTGWGPKEGPNKDNWPKAAGFFIPMKETTVTLRAGDQVVPTLKWVENKEVSKALGKTPRLIEIISLFKTPEEMWESYLAMYSGDGLACRGNGIGTDAKYLEYGDNGERIWKKKPCTFTECPDYISGACKATGLMKVYPTVDATPPNPYKLTTRSMGTIRNIESSLDDIWSLVKTAHAIKEMEAGKQLPFDGLFGLKMYLNHKQARSGGKDVYVTELIMSKEFRSNIMEVINRAIEKKSETAAMIGGEGELSLLEAASSKLIETSAIEVANTLEE